MEKIDAATVDEGRNPCRAERQQAALLALGRQLKEAGYRFVSPTPLTYSRVLKRPRPATSDPLVETFGWNRPFTNAELDQTWRDLLLDGDLIETAAQGGQRSRIRFSTLGGLLFAHSSFPTEDPDSVFFGPDTYRFARAIRWLYDCEPGFSPRTIVDIGAGTGAGGLFAASLLNGPHRTILADINRRALCFAEVNALLNRQSAEICLSDVLANVDSDADLIVSNPPYLVDVGARAYRHGGGDWGCALAVRILQEALGRLTPNGRLLIYTGAPVVQGSDMFLKAAMPVLNDHVRDFHYEEQDPDVFGEELENAPYDRADRIATVVLHVKGADIIR